MTLSKIINYASVNGGVNNKIIVHVMSGFCSIAQFSGKTSDKKADKYIKDFK